MKPFHLAMFCVLLSQSNSVNAEELSCDLNYEKTLLLCSVVADQVSVLSYQINRGKCSVGKFNFPILLKDPRILGEMSFDDRKALQFRIAQINHIIEGRAERYRGFEPTAKIADMNDQEINDLFGQLMSSAFAASGTVLSDELIVPTSELTSELLSALWSNFNLPVIGSYHFADQFKVEANCEILEVQFDTPNGAIVLRSY